LDFLVSPFKESFRAGTWGSGIQTSLTSMGEGGFPVLNLALQLRIRPLSPLPSSPVESSSPGVDQAQRRKGEPDWR